MSILARILSFLVYSGNILVLMFGLYGYLWRTRFVSGNMAGPFWLFRVYNEGAPLLFYIAALGLVLLWIFRLFSRVLRVKLGDDSERLFTALRVATVLGAVSALPACDVNYNLLESTQFDSNEYHLVQVVDNDQVAYGVFNCRDVGSFYCQIVSNESRPWHGFFPMPPPTPTPLPTQTVVIEGEPILLVPQAPTPTPPAEFLINTYDINGTAEQELTLKIGSGLLGVAYMEMEGTPEP